MSTTPRSKSNTKLNFDAKTLKYGFKRKGKKVYEILCQGYNENLHIGKQNIRQYLNNKSKDDIDTAIFHINNEMASRVANSWIAGEEFKQIYESKT